VDTLGTIFLYLHIGGVIVAFGPTIAFPFIATKAANEPMHGNFALRVIETVAKRVVEPGAVFVFLMGVGLIWTRGYNPFTTLWLAIAIILFIINFAVAFVVALPTNKRMIEMTSGPPPTASGAPAGAGAAPASGGPPPEFVALATRAQRAGMFQMLVLFVILFLMIVKPFA
jgi:hypothetical protein